MEIALLIMNLVLASAVLKLRINLNDLAEHVGYFAKLREEEKGAA